MKELKEKLEKAKKIKEKMLEWLELECCKGQECFDVTAAGMVSDIAKDMAELEKDCMKAKYYEEIIEAMKEEEGPYGYDNWRYPSSGRFASKGHGSYMGYMPMEEYEDENWEKIMAMGYSTNSTNTGRGGSGRSGRGGSQSQGMGNRSGNTGGSSGSYGYDPMKMMPEWSDKGVYYDRYKDAKRHYHESKDQKDKEEMNASIGKNVSEIVSQLREMSADASPEQKRKLNSELTSLMEDVKMMM